MPATLLGLQLGRRPGRVQVFRQRVVGPDGQGGAGAHRRPVGGALRAALARRAAGTTGRDLATTRPRNPTGISDFTGTGEPVHALRVRRVDGSGVPERAVRT